MKSLLKKLNACQEAIEWVGDKSLEQAWNTCHRGDWMLWIYAKLYPDNLKELTLAKGHCANTVRHLMKDQRSLDAVDAAIAFGEGRITSEELKKAASDAYDAASYADAAAAYAASDAAADAAAADAAAADAYADAYAYAARTKNQQETADICRKYLTI